MKTLPPDELRATAGSAHFPRRKPASSSGCFAGGSNQETLKEDAERFSAALRQAGWRIKKQQHEPAIFLVNLFERDVSLAQAAADLGLEKSELDQKMEAAGLRSSTTKRRCAARASRAWPSRNLSPASPCASESGTCATRRIRPRNLPTSSIHTGICKPAPRGSPWN